MCLAVPGQVAQWLERTAPFARARVEFGGVGRVIGMQCVPEAEIGDYVLVHAGIAISRLDPREAQRLLETLEKLELDDEEGP